MKKSRVKSKEAKISNSFDATVYKTERTCCSKISEWINRIIEEHQLDIGPAEVETRSKDDKYPDVVIFATPRSDDLACVMEFKQPYFDPFNEDNLKEPARRKATHRHAPYFVTSNFQELVWWNTALVNSAKQDYEQMVNRYTLSKIEDLNQIEEYRYKESIKRGLEQFILKLYAVYNKKEVEPKQAIDEFLIYWLHNKVNRLAKLYYTVIEDASHKDRKFSLELKKWFIDQGWSPTWSSQDFDKAARQTAYLLVNKILFYDLLQVKRPDKLAPLEIPEGLLKGAQLQKILQSFFDEILKIDYETIYTTDFIDSIAFPDAKEVVKEIKELTNVLKGYDFSTLGYDVIGRIFERLIPQDERHNLGQYFTNADVVDIILKFCLNHEDNKVLDPACGAGTFLVSAYQHKKLMNQRLEHEKILDTLWGNDIAKFPAHLATINLAINDLGVDKNYPNILQEDFFALIVGDKGFDLPEKYRKRLVVGLGKEKREVTYPRWFDAVVGNPPYTRQEEIPEIGVDKEKLIERALKDPSGKKKLAEIGKRAGIHAYFFVHGTKFLIEGGYFGFIVSNSWLDVDYGKGLQEFFLKNYKIITIIESKVERWFEEADINTCIIILQKCSDKKERDENLVRFVYLKKPLRNFIPPAQDIWEKQLERLNAIDKLKKTILAHNDFYENEELRIYPKSQADLWEEGFDPEEDKYVGAKWGKYLRAPEIFFKILEKGKGKLVPLKQIAKVRFGIKTGANEFFYLTEEEIKKKGIEKEFWMHKDKKGKWVPNYVMEKAVESNKPEIELSILKKRVLFIDKDLDRLKAKGIISYIKNGERKHYSERPTCASREPGRKWYNLGESINDIIAFPERVRLRHIVFYNPHKVSLNKNLYGIKPKHKEIAKALTLTLNSTLIPLYLELFARQPGGGGGPLDIDVYVAEDILVPKIALLNRYKRKILKISILKRRTHPVFSELGASSPSEVSLDKVMPDRKGLDKIIMGEILGLTDEEQLEVYKAVVDLVRSRIERAKSVGTDNKMVEGVNIYGIRRVVMDNLLRDGE